METQGDPAHTFRGLGIAPAVLGVLDRLGYASPTPIQHQAIAPAAEGKDIVGVAQTGTGKTLAFGVPVIQRLLSSGKGYALVLVPTRELALQVDETFRKVGESLGIRTAVLIGGASIGPQIGALRRNPRVLIATPGRLLDHLEQKTLRLDGVSVLVLDEADRMLDMGFMPQIKRILAALPAERQTMLFSATLSPEILAIATRNMKLPLQIEVAPQGTTAERVTQELFVIRRDDKLRLLKKVLDDHRGSTLVFTRTKHGASRVARKVSAMGHAAAEIHGNRSLNQRRAALDGFKTGKYRVLVATDIAARGIDVKGIELVVNFDMPTQTADYVHRIGRTARAGAAGHAISFVQPEERRGIRDIERLIRKPIPLSSVPELPDAPELAVASRPEGRPVRRSHGGFGGPRRSPHRGSFPARAGGSRGRGYGGRPSSGRSPYDLSNT